MFLQTTLLSSHNTDFKTKPLLKYLCTDCIFSSVLTSACIGVRRPAHTWLYGKPLWDTCKEPHALRRLFLTSKAYSFTAAQCAKVAVWCWVILQLLCSMHPANSSCTVPQLCHRAHSRSVLCWGLLQASKLLRMPSEAVAGGNHRRNSEVCPMGEMP